MTDAASGLYKMSEVLILNWFKLLISLEVLLPLSLYFSIIFAMARLANSNELTILRSVGLSDLKLKKIVILFGIFISIVVGALSVYARPWAYQQIYAMKEHAQSSSEIERIKARQFYSLNDGKRVVYIEKITGPKNSLSEIFIRTKNEKDIQIIAAPTGSMELLTSENTHTLTLNRASVFQQSHESSDLIGKFQTLTLELQASSEIDLEYKAKAASTFELVDQKSLYDKAELQWRLSTPISTIALVLIALMLVDNQPRTSRFSKLPIAIASYAIYYNIITVSKTWTEQGFLTYLWIPLVVIISFVLIISLIHQKRTSI
jgi:lipopolysaccharide export system permease protein